MKKRIAALLLCLVMAMSLIPTTALAAGLGVQSAEDGISAAVDADQQAVKDEPTDEGKAPEQEVVQPAVEEPTDEEKTPEQPVNQPVENEEENNTAAPQNGLLDAEDEDAGVSVQGNWNPDDKITITVDVFDMSTNTIYRDVADPKPTCRKGDKSLIQSDRYTLPALNQICKGATYTKIDHIEGNWYWPGTLGGQVDMGVYWSCNASTGRMTYYVYDFEPGTSGEEKPDNAITVQVVYKDGLGSRGYTLGDSTYLDPKTACSLTGWSHTHGSAGTTKNPACEIPSPLFDPEMLIQQKKLSINTTDFNPLGWKVSSSTTKLSFASGIETRYTSTRKATWSTGKTIYLIYELKAPVPSSFTGLVQILCDIKDEHKSSGDLPYASMSAKKISDSEYYLDLSKLTSYYENKLPTYKEELGNIDHVQNPPQKNMSVTFKWNGSFWNVTPAVFHVKCETTPGKPDEPGEIKLNNDYLDGNNIVAVVCETIPSTTTPNHNATYGVTDANGKLDSKYVTVSDPVKVNNKYTCKLTLNLAAYFTTYQGTHSDPAHTRTDSLGATKVINLEWDAEATNAKGEKGVWKIADTTLTGKPLATIEVKCDTTTPGYKDPTLNVIEGIPDEAVLVNCQTITGHNDSYALDAQHVSFTKPAKDGNDYKCTMTVDLKKYFEEDYWNGHGGATLHPQRTDSLGKTYEVELTWNATKELWTFEASKLPVTMTTKCVPTVNPGNIKLPTGGLVKVDCQNVDDHDHLYTTMLNGAVEFTPATQDANGTWTCKMNINLASYLADYKTNVRQSPEHTNATLPDKYEVTLTWNTGEQKWEPETGKLPAVIRIACEPDTPTEDQLDGLTGAVEVNCVNTKAADHVKKTYALEAGTYDIGNIYRGQLTSGANAWFCDLRLKNEGTHYVDKYTADHGKHTTVGTPDYVIVRLEQTGTDPVTGKPVGNWVVDETAKINVICAPTVDDLASNIVTIDCVNPKVSHSDWTTNAAAGTLQFSDAIADGKGGYYCDVKIIDTKDYVGLYNTNVAKDHSATTGGKLTLRLVWTPNANGVGSWALETANDHFIINVTCSTGGTTPPGGNNIGPAKNPYIKDEPKTVQSGKTFDAGIALYVGLGILSMTGGAVVIRRKKEF